MSSFISTFSIFPNGNWTRFLHFSGRQPPPAVQMSVAKGRTIPGLLKSRVFTYLFISYYIKLRGSLNDMSASTDQPNNNENYSYLTCSTWPPCYSRAPTRISQHFEWTKGPEVVELPLLLPFGAKGENTRRLWADPSGSEFVALH
jgi:hypothetical protein